MARRRVTSAGNEAVEEAVDKSGPATVNGLPVDPNVDFVLKASPGKPASYRMDCVPKIENVMNVAGPDLSVEIVTATWGEEQFSPKQFHSFRVGPFSATGAVRPGETRAQALGRLNDDLRAFAEGEKRRKFEEYMRSAKEFSGR